MIVFSVLMMCLSIVLQGAYFWFRDAFARTLPAAFFASDLVWVLCLISLLLFRWWPWLTVVCAWGLFLTIAIVLEPYTGDYTPLGFLKINCLALTNLFFAHLGVHLKY